MAIAKFTTALTPALVYTSECGRVKVERHGPRDYLALFDDQPCGFYRFAFQAEAAGHDALGAALEREAVAAPDLGALPDGTPIVVVSDTDGTPMVVEAERGDTQINCDAQGYICGDICGVSLATETTIPDLLRFRDFLNSGAIEALARAANLVFGVELLPPPAAPAAVRVEPFISESGKQSGTSFIVSDVDAYVPAAFGAIQGVEIFPADNPAISLIEFEAISAALKVIQTDPRYQAAVKAAETAKKAA